MQAEHARVRILVVGDEAVGKSSLISTLVSHAFCERDVPPLMADVRIPREESSEGVETVIVDSSAARARARRLDRARLRHRARGHVSAPERALLRFSRSRAR